MRPITPERVAFATALVVAAFGLAFFVGFGTKTTCTNDAFASGYPESACKVIDHWAWFAVATAAVAGAVHVTVGGRPSRSVALAVTVVALVVMRLGMFTPP